MIQTELLKGTLGTIILKLLEEKGRMYGYEIVRLVKEMSDEKILVKEGSLYPALHKLEADKLLVAEEVFIGKRVRRYYSLTPSGKIFDVPFCPAGKNCACTVLFSGHADSIELVNVSTPSASSE